MIRPVDAPISQRFGDNPTRNLPADSWLIQTFGNYQPDGHTGEDYACDVGTPVRAVTSGTVLHIGWMGGAYADNPWWVQPSFAGYCAVIDHGAFVGIYGHCMDGSAKVSKGARVSEGQVFILSGNTGGSTGPHLHFEILPDQWVLNSKYYGRTDPEALFTGTIQTQSAPQEGTLSAAEVAQINAHATAQADRVIQYMGQLMVSGYKVGDKTYPGDAMVNITTQNRVNATLALVQQVLAGRTDLTPDQITQAVKDALAQSVVSVDVNVTGKP